MDNRVFSTIQEAIQDIKAGKPIVLVDNVDRENEGDIVFAASKANHSLVQLLVNEARGLICIPLSEHIAERLRLSPMVENNTDRYKTIFTQSVDAVKETTTGISVSDRLNTLLVLGNEQTKAEDLRKPGHVFPLIAKKGGVLERPGHTEGSIDLLKFAGMYEVAVICEILQNDGEMARLSGSLIDFAQKHQLKIISIDQIIQERLKKETTVEKVSEANLPTRFGDFRIAGFKNLFTKEEAVLLSKGHLSQSQWPLMRIHSQCLTGDVFHSLKCECGEQLDFAMKKIQEQGLGGIIYTFQEGRNIGILNKIKAYALQDEGLDTIQANLALGFPADSRNYDIVAGILKYYQLKSMKILTNNPLKLEFLEKMDFDIKREPIIIPANEKNKDYLEIKKKQMRHIL